MNNKIYEKKASKKFDSLQFRDDFLFCKILTANPDITKELLELILNIRIKSIKVYSQSAIEITSDGRGIRLDVYAEDDVENKVFDVEMQTTSQSNLSKRARYYQGMIDLNLIERGDDFKKLKKSYVIFICMKDPFPPLNRCVYTFENICREVQGLSLDDETCKVFLNVNGIGNEISKGLQDFLKLLKEGRGESVLSKRIEEQVDKARAHREWRLEFMTLYMRDRQNREEGRTEGRVDMIKTALRRGRSIEDIADFLGVSAEEIKKILNSQFVED